jgi:hypothetical protein
MISRFPGPWRIAEFPNGFAVYDAAGRQLGFFYGRANPDMAGHASFLMIDDARQIAADFARLPELLNQTPGRSEVTGSTEDDKLAKHETNRAPQGAPETARLPRATQLSVITVTASPSVEASTTSQRSIAFEPSGRRSPQMLRRPSGPRSIRTKYLIPIALAALSAGYVFFGDSDPPVNVAVVPQVRTDRLSAEFSPLRDVRGLGQGSFSFPVESRIEPEAIDSTVESPMEPEVQTAPSQSTVLLDIKPTENGIEARPPQTLPQKEGQSFAPSQDASTCFPSASAVRQNYPDGWPSWTLRAPGHEGTRCWYPSKRATANDPSKMRRNDASPLPIGATGDTKKQDAFVGRE